MAVRERTVRRPRVERVNASEDKFLVGRSAKRTVSRADGVRTVALKTGHGTMTKTFTKSADAKNSRLGAYARKHKTVNADGSVTYAKKGGGTVTVNESLSEDAKKYTGKRKVGPLGRRRARTRGRTRNNPSTPSTPGGGNDPGTP